MQPPAHPLLLQPRSHCLSVVRIAKALASYFSFNRYPELQSPEKTKKKRIAQNKHLTTSGFAVASSEKRRNILSDHLHLNQIKDKGA